MTRGHRRIPIAGRVWSAIAPGLAVATAAAILAAPAAAVPATARHATPFAATGIYSFGDSVNGSYDFGFPFIEFDEVRIDWAGHPIEQGVCFVFGSQAPCSGIFIAGISGPGWNRFTWSDAESFDGEIGFIGGSGTPNLDDLTAGNVSVTFDASLLPGNWTEPGTGELTRAELVVIGMRGSLTCGDGAVDEFEFCDDGDLASGDGCSDRCAIEHFFACEGEPSVCTPGPVGIREIIHETQFAPGVASVRPERIIRDAQGSVYVGTGSSDVVLVRHPGSSPAILLQRTSPVGIAELNFPTLLARHPDGTLYIGETSGAATDRVLRRTPAGAWSVLMGVTGDGVQPLGRPVDLELDAGGNLFVLGQNVVFRIAPDGSSEVMIDGTGDGSHAFSGSSDIALDAAGNLYVTGLSSSNVFRVTPTGVVTQIIDPTANGSGFPFVFPDQLAVGADGKLYVSTNTRVLVRAGNGTISQVIGPEGAGPFDPLGNPGALAMDAPGRLYVAGGNRVFEAPLGLPGSIRTIIESRGDGQGNPLTAPTSLTVTDPGRIYGVGRDSRNVFEITLDHFGTSPPQVPAASAPLRVLLAACLVGLAARLRRRAGRG
jgi:cysteine-rich repeat protein